MSKMIVSVGESYEFVLEDVFSGVLLRTRDKEEFGICMRDTGFEFQYCGEWYEAKNGVLEKMLKPLIKDGPVTKGDTL